MKRTIIVAFLLLLVAGLFGQGMGNLTKKTGPDFGLKTVGLRVGAVIPSTKYDPTYGISGTVDIGTLTDFLGMGIELEYWKAKQHTNGADVFYRAIGGGLTVYYLPTVEWKIKPKAGLGLGVYSYKKDYPDNWDQTDKTELNPFEPHLEIQLDYPLEGDFDLTGGIRANLSNISGYGIYIGAEYKL